MANTNAFKGFLVDGQLTIETKDDTNPTSPLPMTTFTTTAMHYADDPFRPGFYITVYKDKGHSSERHLTISFPTGQEPRITDYTETITTETAKYPYGFEIMDDTSKIENMVITPDKHRYNVVELKFMAKSLDSNETRVVTGRGHISITDLTKAL